jgi:transposase
VENCVGASASIEVNRRHRRAKPDRLDVHKLLTMLWRHRAGERKVWSGVRVPSIAEEARRQLHRALLRTQRDRTRVSNRMQGLLAGWGVRLTLPGDGAPQLEQVRQGEGSPLPPALRARLHREGQQAHLLTAQLARLETERREAWRPSEAPAVEQVRQLLA